MDRLGTRNRKLLCCLSDCEARFSSGLPEDETTDGAELEGNCRSTGFINRHCLR
jgi:hypothetical protein